MTSNNDSEESTPAAPTNNPGDSSHLASTNDTGESHPPVPTNGSRTESTTNTFTLVVPVASIDTVPRAPITVPAESRSPPASHNEPGEPTPPTSNNDTVEPPMPTSSDNTRDAIPTTSDNSTRELPPAPPPGVIAGSTPQNSPDDPSPEDSLPPPPATEASALSPPPFLDEALGINLPPSPANSVDSAPQESDPENPNAIPTDENNQHRDPRDALRTFRERIARHREDVLNQFNDFAQGVLGTQLDDANEEIQNIRQSLASRRIPSYDQFTRDLIADNNGLVEKVLALTLSLQGVKRDEAIGQRDASVNLYNRVRRQRDEELNRNRDLHDEIRRLENRVPPPLAAETSTVPTQPIHECQSCRVKTEAQLRREIEQQHQIYEVSQENKTLKDRISVLESEKHTAAPSKTGTALDDECYQALHQLNQKYIKQVSDNRTLREENDRLVNGRLASAFQSTLQSDPELQKKNEKLHQDIKYLRKRLDQVKQDNVTKRNQSPDQERRPAAEQPGTGANHKRLLQQLKKYTVENKQLKRELDSVKQALQNATQGTTDASDTLANKLLRKELQSATQAAAEATNREESQNRIIDTLNLEIRTLQKRLALPAHQSQGTASGPAALQKTIAQMEQTINKLRLDREQLANAHQSLMQSLHEKSAAEKDASIEMARLKNIIANLRNSGNRPGVPDWQLERESSDLHNRILQYVYRHCRNYNGSVGVHRALATPEAKDAYLMGFISDFLYRHVFSPEGMEFALGKRWNGYLTELEYELRTHRTVPEDVLCEWKKRTCSLREYIDTNYVDTEDGKEKIILKGLYETLAGKLLGELDRMNCFYLGNVAEEQIVKKKEAVVREMQKICKKAFELASMCRNAGGSELRWLQSTGEVLAEELVDVFGSAGYLTYADAVRAGNDFMIVFGAFARPVVSETGGKGWRALRKSKVFLGPFGLRP